MNLRRVIFWSHLTAGVTCGLVILVMSVTGVLLAFEPQIVELAERDLRVTVARPGAAKLGADAILERARETRPDARPVSVTVRADPAATASVSFGRGDELFVEPYTGAVLGAGSRTHQVLHTIEEWHRWLGSRDLWKPVTGACNAAFFVLAISGIYLWWPRRWSKPALAAVTWFDGRLAGRARDFNWHNTIGFWCAPVLAVISLTGVIMSYQWANDLLYRVTGNEPPPPVMRQTPPPGGRPEGRREGARERPPIDVAALVDRAAQQAPGWSAITVRLAQRPNAPVTIVIQEPPTWRYPNRRSQLTLDARTRDVVKWEPFAEQNLGRRLRTWARFLHTGEAGGIGGQIVAAVASAGGVMLVWTGLSLAWRRFRRWMRRAEAENAAQPETATR